MCIENAPVDTIWDFYPFHFSLFYHQLPVDPDGAFEEYRYDALGRRVWVRSRQPDTVCKPALECISVVARTIWDGDQRLYEIRYPGGVADSLQWERDTGAVMVSGVAQPHNGHYGRVAYIHGGQIDIPLAIIRMDYRADSAGTVIYTQPFLAAIHTDWKGAIDQTTVDSATVAQHQNESATPGGWIPSNGVAGLSPTFGYRLSTWNGSLLADQQDRSGLLYRRNRYADPLTGRFTQEDPIGLAGGLNLYGFAEGDPVSYSDPFGLCPPKSLAEVLICTGEQLRPMSEAADAVGKFGMEMSGASEVERGIEALAKGDLAEGGVALAMALPAGRGVKGIVKSVRRLDTSVRGTRDYAIALFRKLAGDKPLEIMRDRRTGRITGVRTEDGQIMWRPKKGKKGVIANVEVIDREGTRVNIHVRQ